jgi:hypothetical protein
VLHKTTSGATRLYRRCSAIKRRAIAFRMVRLKLLLPTRK